jgi:15-cis-phytoene synthase
VIGSAPSSGDLASAYDYCETLTRDHDRDRWLAGLFAPQQARKQLYALTAFSYETGRLREITRETLANEMRLQWWREAIGGDRAGEANANPVAAALIDTIGRFNLPRTAFDDMAAARNFDLYDDPPATLRDLEGYCGETCSSLFQLGAIILGEGRDLGAAEAAGHSGVAYAIVGQLRALPITSARHQVFIPADVLAAHGVGREDIVGRRDAAGVRAALAEMRDHARRHFVAARSLVASLPSQIKPAFLPLFLVPLYLARLERGKASPFTETAETPQWRRQWALWRAARAM